jgi:phosphoribosylaminoimidazole (AIR) synthetase
MAVVVRRGDVDAAVTLLAGHGESAAPIGRIEAHDGEPEADVSVTGSFAG